MGLIDDAIDSLTTESYQWRVILEELRANLIAEGAEQLADEVNGVLQGAIGDIGVEVRCSIDFLAERAAQQLGALVGRKPLAKPRICRPTPGIVEMADPPPYVRLHGYNLDQMSDQVRLYLVDYRGNEIEVTGDLTTTSPYEWVIDLGAHGVPLDDSSDRIDIHIPGQPSPTSIEIVQPHHRERAQLVRITGTCIVRDAGRLTRRDKRRGKKKRVDGKIDQTYTLTPAAKDASFQGKWEAGARGKTVGELKIDAHLDPVSGSVFGDANAWRDNVSRSGKISRTRTEEWTFDLLSDGRAQFQDKLGSRIDYFSLTFTISTRPTSTYWMPATGGHIPKGAEDAGHEDYGDPPLALFIARAQAGGSWIPGKVRPGLQRAHFVRGDPPDRREAWSDDYEVLVGPVRWERAIAGRVPPASLVAGHEDDGTPLYVARAWLHGGLQLGMAVDGGPALIPYGGQGSPVEDFEVVVQDVII